MREIVSEARAGPGGQPDARLREGRRPSWSAAAPRAISEPLIEAFVSSLRLLGAGSRPVSLVPRCSSPDQ